MARALTLLLLLSCVAACSGGGGAANPGSQNFRPGSAPDIVLLSVSGRCGVFCVSPGDNVAYLGEPGDAAEAIAVAFQGAGLTVDRADYIAALFDDDAPERFGFLTLVADIQWIHDNWIDGFADPTRIVIVGHSHGAEWAHIACGALPAVPIEYLISLDASCLLWESDYGTEVANYLATNGNPYGWDISSPCDAWPVTGQASLFDTDDVAFDNVVVNLEVQATGFIQDLEINYRLDGTQVDILTHESTIDDHGGVHDPLGDSIPWVLAQLAALGY